MHKVFLDCLCQNKHHLPQNRLRPSSKLLDLLQTHLLKQGEQGSDLGVWQLLLTQPVQRPEHFLKYAVHTLFLGVLLIHKV